MFLVIGDPHFKPENALETNILHEETFKIAHNYDFIVILGDTLHSHNKADLQAFVRACKWIKDLSTKAKTFLLIGNHDRLNNKISSGEEHFFFPLKDKGNIIVVDSPHSEIINGRKYSFMPYTEPGLFVKTAEKYNLNLMDSNIIFAHQEFAGSINNRDGDVWPEEAPLIITGHIHEHRRLTNNILYPGTPFMLTYGCSEDKGIYEFENCLEFKRIILPIPKKITIDINAEEFHKETFPENTYIRIRIQGTPNQKNAIIASDKFKMLMSNRMIKVVFIMESKAAFLDEIIKEVSTSKKFIDRVDEYLVTDSLKSLFSELIK